MTESSDSARPRASKFALFNLGFRPFYLLASVFAAVSIALWALEYSGHLPRGYLQSPLWHGHEMLFGYTIAVIAGFLFTAVRNWTGQPTPTGPTLALLALLWLLGRVLVPTRFGVAAALVDAAFPIAVAAGIAVPLVRSGNRRNYFFAALLVLLALLAMVFHLAYAGVIAWPVRVSLQLALDIVLFIMVVMGGRVIPMFTNNAIPGTQARRVRGVESAALGSVVALFIADLLQLPGIALVLITAFAAAAHLLRLALWQPWRTLRTPLVWILHASYAWIVVHLALRALALGGLVAEPLATHALTIGAVGGLTIGMMTRTARGHTGRTLIADGYETACYVLVQLAAIVRVFGAMVLASAYRDTVLVSAALWVAAFTIYAIRYWPVLAYPRMDGKPG
ncbi:MAG TPA: NnrS family protein [Casimicrobiaceae bacterium]|nr:NnrS family protein [Casimicrobiaceae bacterium]